MATFELDSSFNSLPDSSVIPNYQGHPVVQAKLVDFSVFRPFNSKEVFHQLQTFFEGPDMIVIAHSDSPQPIPMSLMTLEALNEAMMQRLRNETQALLGDEHINVYNDLKMMVEANDDDSPQAMVELLQLCFTSVLQAISVASVKKGALFSSPFTQKPLLLLGYRGLYISDKAKVAAAVKKIKKSAAKAASSGKPKKANAPAINPQGKPRRTISDEEEDNQSEATIEDASSHGDNSPYNSDWAHSSHSSRQATPVLEPQPLPSDEPVQLTLTPNDQAPAFTPRLPMNIHLPINPVVPLIPAGVLGTPTALGGTLGSVPGASSTSKKSARRKSKKSGKSKKAKKTKRSRSRSRSRSSSLSSVQSIVVPPPPPVPKPSADQVFFLYLLVSFIPLSIDTVWVTYSFTN